MEKKRILCFGDSLTWGADPDVIRRLPEDSRWPMVLQDILGDGYRIIEEGQNSRTIACDDPAGEKNAIRYITPCLESHDPLDLVIIMLGVNNCKRKFSNSAMDVAGEMQIFLEKVLSFNHFYCNDHFKILLMAPPAISDDIMTSWLGDSYGFEVGQKISVALPELYRNLAERYNIYFLNAADYGVVSGSDGIHMNAENQRKLGKAVAECVQKIFDEQ